MKELTFGTLIAVFEEMFGPVLFWAMVAAAAIVTVLFVYVLVRDRGLESGQLVRAELAAPVGAVAAIAFVMWATSSGLSDIGGPIDVIVMIVIGVVGAVGLAILAYVAQRLFAAPRRRRAAGGRRRSRAAPARPVEIA
jgi:hypothetical protein